jgi:hypothetical protein
VLVPCFLLFLCFRKATQEIFSELDETKAKVPIFPGTRRSPKQRRRGARGQSHHRVAWATPGRATRWCGPLVHPLTLPFHLYILLDEKTLKARTLFQKIYCKPPSSSMQDREGPEVLPGTLPERGITTGGLLHHHACLWSDVWYVSNVSIIFDTPCLFIHHLLCVLITLHGVFMHFPELTY